MPAPARTRPAHILFLALIVAGCFTLGCLAQPSPTQPNATANETGFGFRPGPAGDVSGEPQGLTFSDVTNRLGDMGPDTGNDPASNASAPAQVLYVHGIRLNEKGDAAIWTLAVRYGNQTSIVTYDLLGRHTAPWKGEVRWKEIQLDSIVPPEALFARNQAAITPDQGGNLTVTRDLVLSDDTYTLTLTAPGSRKVLTFNATTGEQLK